MHDFTRSFSSLISAAAVAALMGGAGMAAAQNYDAELQRGARADATPQQRYQTAIREAGGGLKVSLAECRNQAAAERKACESQARAAYKKDMDYARELRNNPDARPFSVQGEPVRMTETPIKP